MTARVRAALARRRAVLATPRSGVVEPPVGREPAPAVREWCWSCRGEGYMGELQDECDVCHGRGTTEHPASTKQRARVPTMKAGRTS